MFCLLHPLPKDVTDATSDFKTNAVIVEGFGKKKTEAKPFFLAKCSKDTGCIFHHLKNKEMKRKLEEPTDLSHNCVTPVSSIMFCDMSN